MDEYIEEMLRLKKNLARRALESGDLKSAWNHLTQALATLSTNLTTPAYDRAYASASLELADLSFTMGKGFGELIIILQKALPASERLGNRRFQAMISLHLARLYYFGGEQPKAMDAFVLGKKEVEKLGDEDILDQAAEFIGLYYLIQGLFHESLQYFERAAQSFESSRWGRIMNPSGPMWLSYCFAYLGQFHRAIGTLAYYRGLAADRGDKALANTLESVLGIVLTLARKNKEAEYHLANALLEARKISNVLAAYFSFGGFAFLYYLQGRILEARDITEKAIALGSVSGLIYQYTTPTAIELLFEIERRGIAPPTEFTFHGELNRILKEPNLHLRGVALRLKAKGAAIKGEDPLMVDTDLSLSEKHLIRSGDPIQLGKTRLEMARQELSRGNMENARAKARKAWSGFSAGAEAFFPDDLKHLLPDKHYKTATEVTGKVSLETFAAIIQELSPTTDVDELLTRTITATNRFFGAERGGIFWFTDKGAPILRAACNLSQGDVQAQAFRTSLSLIIKTRKENQPHMARYADTADRPPGLKAALCVPIQASGDVQGVLYHDNSFLKDSFDHYEKDQLVHISQTLNSYVEKILRFGQNLEKKAMDTLSHMTAQVSYDIITQNSGMLKMLEQADLIAETNSTVLITGKTGVGKELLARRIHKTSARRDKPLVILDPTSVPETLIESELFGHEKGAFTGADRQRKGRMELAHNGTLFIDEVGEIPKSSQVKLLRVLQEKSLVRLGGTRNIRSDFRLIAATNRDLSKEVAEGNFREDLFYRLNVIPIALVPLRERTDDIPLLAEHFLAQYAAKYNRSDTVLNSEDKKLLMAYDWPGNVRELQNVIERAVLLSTGDQLELNLPGESTELPAHISDDMLPLDEIQRRYIRHVLRHTKGKISGPTGAAHFLGMKPSTLYNRMKKLGIRH